jgi:hypothetical protein
LNRGLCPRTPEILRFTARIAGRRAESRSIPANPGRRVGAQVASPQSLYSGSEGEMLRKGFSTVVAVARCGNPAVIRAEPRGQFGRTQPLRIAEPDIRCPRIELRTAGARQQPESSVLRLFIAVQYGTLDSAGAPRLRIALPDTRCPRIELRAAGCALLPKRILRCRLEVD